MDKRYTKYLESRIKEYEDCFVRIRLLLLRNTCMISNQCLKDIEMLFKHQPFLFANKNQSNLGN